VGQDYTRVSSLIISALLVRLLTDHFPGRARPRGCHLRGDRLPRRRIDCLDFALVSMGRYSYDGGVCRSLASGPVPEDLNRAAFYEYSVLKIGTKQSRIARDSLAFDMVRRRPDTSPIILSFFFLFSWADRPSSAVRSS
jgi:hypothetical protein